MLALSAIPAYAEDGEDYSGSIVGFWDVALYDCVTGTSWIPFFGNGVQRIAGAFSGDVCGYSDDAIHHATSLSSNEISSDAGGQYAMAICDDCHQPFKVYGADLKQSYADYTATLPASVYTSSGGLSWKIIPFAQTMNQNTYYSYERYADYGTLIYIPLYSYADSLNFFYLDEDFIAPVAGYYSVSVITLNGLKNSEITITDTQNFDKLVGIGATVARNGTNTFSTNYIFMLIDRYDGINERDSGYWSGYLIITCVPYSFSGDTYSTTTRPTSITGGNYGIIGDNGQITKIEDNSTIVNETNNTYYNPATGGTGTITDWSYDYSTRSYNLTLNTGDIVTVTYGDENITITETTGDTTGDLITNNYTIYYIVEGSGSGSETPENPPDSHTHDWRETSYTEPTCIASGKRIYTCAICSSTTQDTIPALGHDWRVLRTVTNEYDEDGTLVTEGYILYQCDRCHEQYKTTDTSTRPTPGGGTTTPGSGPGTGSDDDDGASIWDKLGEFLGSTLGALLDFLGGILTGLLDGLISLVTGVMESLTALVDLFGSFGDALGVLWTWLPPEIMSILVAGVSILVVFALLKIFMK